VNASNTIYWSSAGAKACLFSSKQNSSGMWQAETAEHLLSWAARHKKLSFSLN